MDRTRKRRRRARRIIIIENISDVIKTKERNEWMEKNNYENLDTNQYIYIYTVESNNERKSERYLSSYKYAHSKDTHNE